MLSGTAMMGSVSKGGGTSVHVCLLQRLLLEPGSRHCVHEQVCAFVRSRWAEAFFRVSKCQMADEHTDLFFIRGGGLRQQWCETL